MLALFLNFEDLNQPRALVEVNTGIPGFGLWTNNGFSSPRDRAPNGSLLRDRAVFASLARLRGSLCRARARVYVYIYMYYYYYCYNIIILNACSFVSYTIYTRAYFTSTHTSAVAVYTCSPYYAPPWRIGKKKKKKMCSFVSMRAILYIIILL